MICDFCGDPDPQWSYTAKPFAIYVGGLELGEDGKWCACDVCHGLIEKGLYSTMTERSVLKMVGNDPILQPDIDEIRKLMTGIHQQFASLRLGDAVRMEKQEE